MRTKRWIVVTLESCCCVIDRLPGWTYPVVGRWLGCPSGFAFWSGRLDRRWGTGLTRQLP
ncbi:hypothetical protein [Terrabacter sp. C0L_2]|jgi:hypothetical protein|uniref:hypothetical protein n=1 Tax=Terrabacter sp. C0L_2 TaxID=3108389 RepID=UPI0018377914|nr:hypothetical protein [Dermatophilaceae bacterium]WVM95514.1 hypothetical protein U5C87_16120 [Terrabacter sp. C0L_2]